MKKSMKTRKFVSALLLGSIVLTSVAPQQIQAASLNKKKVVLTVGEKTTLKVKGMKKKIKWSSNKVKVATVNAKGKITAKSIGKAKITAKAGKKTYVCTVTVKAKEQTADTPTQAPTQVAATTQPTAAPQVTGTPQVSSSVQPTAQGTATPQPTDAAQATNTPASTATAEVQEPEESELPDDLYPNVNPEDVTEEDNDNTSENDESGIDDPNDNEPDDVSDTTSGSAVASSGSSIFPEFSMGSSAASGNKKLFSLVNNSTYIRTDAIAVYGEYIFVLKDIADSIEHPVYAPFATPSTEFRLECYRKDNNGSFSGTPLFKKNYTAQEMVHPKDMTYYDGALYIATNQNSYAMKVKVNLTGRSFGSKSRCKMSGSIPCNGITFWKEFTVNGVKVPRFIVRGSGNNYYVYDYVNGELTNRVKCSIPTVKGYTGAINGLAVHDGFLYVSTHNSDNKLKNRIVEYYIDKEKKNGQDTYTLDYCSFYNVNASSSNNKGYHVKGIAYFNGKLLYCTNETTTSGKNADAVYRKVFSGDEVDVPNLVGREDDDDTVHYIIVD